MNNQSKVTFLAIFMAVFAVCMVVSVNAQTTNGSDDLIAPANTTATGTGNGGDEPVNTSAAAVTSNGADDYVGTSPSGTGATTAVTYNGGDDLVSSGGSSTGGSTSGTSNGGDDITPAPTTPVNPVITTGGGGSSSSGSSILSFVNLTGTSTCPLLKTYIKAGAKNDPAEVAKLQSFLRAFQGDNISMNGIYDEATQKAVRTFQSKYLGEVMGPWGATQSSGFVYITTLKKINQLACQSPFVLSANDLAIIDSYKARLAAGTEGASLNSSITGPTLETGSSTGASSTSDEIGTNARGSETAAVGNTSILKRFWNFILSLFR